MLRRHLLALASAAPLVCARPQIAMDGAIDAAEVRTIDAAAAKLMADERVPGMSIAVGRNDKVAWCGGYGFADIENQVPARAATVYRTASIAKPMTAVAAMQLVERGKLDLDAPVQKYVPSFPEKPWPVSTRQLLGHIGGIRHYRDGAEFVSTRHYTSVTSAVQQFANDDLVAEPGTKYVYSTFGFVLAGAVVESVADMPFADYLHRNIFMPAGMIATRTDDIHDIIPNRSRGYSRDASGRVRNCDLSDTSNKIPGGGLVSTAEDLVRFAFAVGTGRLLGESALREMLTPLHTRDGQSTGYGLGWGVNEFRGHTQISHAGGQAGVSTILRYLPAEKLAVAAMFNLEGTRFTPLIDTVLAAELG